MELEKIKEIIADKMDMTLLNHRGHDVRKPQGRFS